MARSKQKAIEHMEIIEAPDRYNNKTFKASFQPTVETGNDVLSVSNLEIGYECPLSTVTFDLKKGEKLGILGGNGLGKSTFLKTIVDKIPALSGEYKYGVNVQVGYFDQQMAMYQSNKTVLEDYWDEFPNLTETEVRNALGAFLFTGEDVFKNINMLSGGEKVRLALCKILKRKPNVLILDEPTNHMDIIGKETLENMLKEFKGTLIFVSHDRYFVKQVATQLLVFENGTTELFRFGYEEYQEKLEREAAEEERANQGSMVLGGLISNKGGTVATSGVAASADKKPYYNPGKERSKLEKKIKKAEEELAIKEEKLEGLKQELLNPMYQSSYSKLTEIQGQIDALEEEVMADMEVWEELSSQLEELQS
jgi:ATP-binding cassette subfamily F protein 3